MGGINNEKTHLDFVWSVGVTVALQVSGVSHTGEALPGEKVRFLHAPMEVIKSELYLPERRTSE